MHPIHLDAPVCLDVPITFGCQHTFGSIHTYRGQPNIWMTSKHTGDVKTMWGHSNHIEGCPNIGGTQTYGGV